MLGYKLASDLGSFLGKKLGPQFRSKKLILNNLNKFNSQINESEKARIRKAQENKMRHSKILPKELE